MLSLRIPSQTSLEPSTALEATSSLDSSSVRQPLTHSEVLSDRLEDGPNSASPELSKLASKVKLIDGIHNSRLSRLMEDSVAIPVVEMIVEPSNPKGSATKSLNSKHKRKQGLDKGGPKQSPQ